MTDPGRDGGGRTSRRTAWRQRRIARIARGAANQIAGKPAQGEGRRIAAAEQHRTGPLEVIDCRAVGLRHQILLEPCAIGRSEPCLIRIDLYRDRNPSQRTRVLAAGHKSVDLIGLFPHPVGPMRDDCIDLRVDRVEPLERGFRCFPRRDFASANEVSKFSCGQTP
jgi:hypothetical protein